MKKLPCLILARGGSKGVPKKNIKILLDKPLIAWVIESAKDCQFISDIYVSTDCDEISRISSACMPPTVISAVAIKLRSKSSKL